MAGFENRKMVFVAMSGGVDSSVVALLLKRRGCRVVGVHLRCYNVDGCAERDAEDARRVAAVLNIPFYVWDFEEEYKKRVVEYMVEGYRMGHTPNPDVACNREIKFGLFLDAARRAGADAIATGHYVVRRQVKDGSFALYEAKDINKDQSYFLWTLRQEQLRHSLFPIGAYLKSDVRALARRAGLPVAEKKDSQGVCFLGKVTLADFLKTYIPEQRGSVVTVGGTKIGEHRGAAFYTIGQRHGLDVKSKNRALGVRGAQATNPHYVVRKNIDDNTLVVAEGSTDPSLFKKEISLAGVNFVQSLSKVPRSYPVFARVRYRQPLSAATLSIQKAFSADSGAIVSLAFTVPQRFVAPGQSAVFYSKRGVLLGGGVIIE